MARALIQLAEPQFDDESSRHNDFRENAAILGSVELEQKDAAGPWLRERDPAEKGSQPPRSGGTLSPQASTHAPLEQQRSLVEVVGAACK